MYDKGGEEALKEKGGIPHESAFDIFDMFFGGGRRGAKSNRTKDMIHPLKVCTKWKLLGLCQEATLPCSE